MTIGEYVYYATIFIGGGIIGYFLAPIVFNLFRRKS